MGRCWELRECLSESLLLAHCLPTLKAEFVDGKPPDFYEKQSVQISLLARMVHIFGRRPP